MLGYLSIVRLNIDYLITICLQGGENMEIKGIYEPFFQVNAGIIIDDAYDIHKRLVYDEYITSNKIEYIYAQDNDISNFSFLSKVRYISLNKDCENYDFLNKYTNIECISLYASTFNKMNSYDFKRLEKLCIIFDEEIKMKLPNIKALKLNACMYEPKQLDFKNLTCVKELVLMGFKKINNLEFLPLNISNLIIDYCPKLSDINYLVSLKNLVSLQLVDCNKINNVDKIVCNLKKLDTFSIYSDETSKCGHFGNLNFINNMPNLKKIKTDYMVDNNNLKPLLKLEDVTLLKWKKYYNLRDKDLPHKFVLVKKGKNEVTFENIEKLENGINNQNIIWNDGLIDIK